MCVCTVPPPGYGHASATTWRDSHHALLSWAEIDPDFAHAPVLIATSVDGTGLDTAGPRRVLSQEAGATGLKGLSLIDVAPNGPAASAVSMKCTSVRGTSANRGSR